MLVVVNPKHALWGFGEELFLTYQEPSKDIDPQALSEEARAAFESAIQGGILIEVNKDGKPVRREVQKLQQPLVKDSESMGVQGLPYFMVEKLKELLENGVTTLKREIPLIRSAQQVATLISMERDGKNRKTVLKLLDDQLQKASDLSSPKQLSGSMNMYDSLIEDEEGETVTFDTSDLSVVEEEGEDVESKVATPEVLESSEKVVELEIEDSKEE